MKTQRNHLAAAALLLLAGLGAAGAASAVPVVELRPSTTTVAQGGAFRIDAFASDFVDLFAYQFSLAYAGGVVGATGATEGAFLSSAGTTFFVPGDVDDAAGLISFTGNTLIGPIAGATGSGLLASFTFIGALPGVSTFSLTDVLFLNSALGFLDVTVIDTSVTVTAPPTAAPEPGGMFVLALLSLGIARLLRRTA